MLGFSQNLPALHKTSSFICSSSQFCNCFGLLTSHISDYLIASGLPAANCNILAKTEK